MWNCETFSKLLTLWKPFSPNFQTACSISSVALKSQSLNCQQYVLLQMKNSSCKHRLTRTVKNIWLNDRSLWIELQLLFYYLIELSVSLKHLIKQKWFSSTLHRTFLCVLAKMKRFMPKILALNHIFHPYTYIILGLTPITVNKIFYSSKSCKTCMLIIFQLAVDTYLRWTF